MTQVIIGGMPPDENPESNETLWSRYLAALEESEEASRLAREYYLRAYKWSEEASRRQVEASEIKKKVEQEGRDALYRHTSQLGHAVLSWQGDTN